MIIRKNLHAFVSRSVFVGCAAVSLLFGAERVIQPGPGVAEDCCVQYLVKGLGTYASWPNYNTGKTPCFCAGSYDYYTQVRSLLRFSMPADINPDSVVSAKIVLSVESWSQNSGIEGEYPVDMHRMLRSWKAGNGVATCYQKVPTSSTIDGATALERFWGNQDGTEDWNQPNVGIDNVDAACEIAATCVKLCPDPSAWDFEVTSLVKSWMHDSSTNFGVLIRSPYDNGVNGKLYRYPDFWSGDYTGDSTLRPKLIITYRNGDIATADSSVVAHWTFDEGSGTILHDVSGNGHDGVISGARWANGVRGGALDFDGIDDGVTVPDHDAFTNQKAMTVELWARLDSTYGKYEAEILVTKWGPGSCEDDSWHWATHNNGTSWMYKADFALADGSCNRTDVYRPTPCRSTNGSTWSEPGTAPRRASMRTESW